MRKLFKSKTFLGAVMSIALCCSLIAGATFAIFTSEAAVNIAVTTGKVNVTAQVTKFSLYSPASLNADGTVKDEANAAIEGTFKNGGTASMHDGKLVVAKMAPGDKVTAELTVKNNSNVSVLYRYGYTLLSGDGTAYDADALILFEGLKFDFDGKTAKTVTDDEASVTVAYKTVYAELPESKKISVVVELPGTAGNKYQNLSLTIGFAVEAVQANIDTTNVIEINDTVHFTEKDALGEVTDGETIFITGNNTKIDHKTDIGNSATLAGAGRDKTTVSADKMNVNNNNVTIKDMTIKGSGSAGTGGTLNVDGNNTTIENVDYQGDGNIAITVSTDANNTGTIFRGTKITNAFRGIQFWSLSGNSIIDDCVLDVAGYTFNIDSVVAGSTLTVKNSTLNGWTSYTSGIELVTFEKCKLGLNGWAFLRPYSETVIKDCEFTSAGYQLNAGGSDAYTITITNCTKNGTKITAENVKTLLLDMDEWNTNVTLIVDGKIVELN